MEKVKSQVMDGSGIANIMNAGSVKRIEKRDFLDEQTYDMDKLFMGYRADFNDVVGGVQYWERDVKFVTQDATDEKLYLMNVSFLAPRRNKDVYESIFAKTINDMVDIND